RRLTVDRNLWGASIYADSLEDSWEEPPSDVFTLTRAPETAPDAGATVTVGFEKGVPRRLEGEQLDLVPLIRELNRLGGEHGVGRSDVVEDRLFAIKSREFYETPCPSLLLAAHRDLERLVQSREMIQLKEFLGRRYAELIYAGHWFHDLRRSLQGFFETTQRYVSGDVRLKLFKGSCRVVGRRSPHSLYDAKLASQTNLEWLDTKWSEWAQGFTSLWALPSRLAARRQPEPPATDGGWTAP
ncbi:MAG TPA: argininosuccinate synthase, partial [Gemmataceae bacterium]|nr:argininosuccinate synthase [Gemmataceae bacterium]